MDGSIGENRANSFAFFLHCKKPATPRPLFLSLETAKTASQVPVFSLFFFKICKVGGI
jgi:hypothetical protein